VGKARERWYEQGGTCVLVEGLYWCVGLLLPMVQVHISLAKITPYNLRSVGILKLKF